MGLDPRTLLKTMFEAAVAAASAEKSLPPFLPTSPKGRTVVIGAGKAAAAMAQVVEAQWRGPLSGCVVTPYGHGAPTAVVDVIEAGHPLPDEAGSAAAQHILETVQGLTEDDLVLCLISGGASSLLVSPATGLSLEDKRDVTRSLLRSGATISEINCVRKHLSAVKGGRLAVAAAPAPVVTLVISDVPGDDPATVGSGPTVADSTTFADAQAILRKHEIAGPESVMRHLATAADETPKPHEMRANVARPTVIMSARRALDAAAAVARAQGVSPIILGDAIEGEARDVASAHAALVLRDEGRARPYVLISGGETTVTVTGTGRGGRNSEYLLGLILALGAAEGVHALAADTDGIDGTEANAGAVAGPDTLARAQALGLDAEALLKNNDAYAVFAALGDVIVTGPTRTNVNDFRAVLVT